MWLHGVVSSSIERLDKTRLSTAIGARAEFLSRVSVSQQANAKVCREAQASDRRRHHGEVMTGQH